MANRKRKKAQYATKINPTDPLNWWNKFWFITFVIGLLIEGCGLMFFTEQFNADSIVRFSLISIFVLIVFQYRQLRKKLVFRIWGIISVLMLGFYLSSVIFSDHFSDDYIYAFKSLKIPFVFLISFSVFRWMAKQIHGTELIIPPKGSKFDMDEGRNINFMDVFSMILYFPIIILCMFY